MSNTNDAMPWIAGWGKCELGIAPTGQAMQGYGMWHHRARNQKTPLYARALFLRGTQGNVVIFCCLDMGYVTYAIREAICKKLHELLAEEFREEALILTCTHTHSGPGGCTHDALYNVVTPGFVPENIEHITNASVAAILIARKTAAPTALALSRGRIDDPIEVAWNRSLKAYNRNPDVTRRTETETHLALNREMQVLSFKRDNELCSLLSLFGVHATAVGSKQLQFCSDNKGYAAMHADQVLSHAKNPDAVTFFAQGTAGDVSPHYHGPGQTARRNRIKGEAEYVYAQNNGELQSKHALALATESDQIAISGSLDAVMTYVDFTDIHADARYANGNTEAYTSDPCHGVSFFEGTPVDGLGMPKFLGFGARKIADAIRNRRLNRPEKYSTENSAYYQKLYAAQGPKSVLLESGHKLILGQPLAKLSLPDFADPLVKELKAQAKRGAINQSNLVPTVLPLQVVCIGNVAIVCAPGEFTTMAGERLRQTVAAQLKDKVEHVLICTYCNDYMGYVTTNEEYQEQAYEGGHTIYGQWTLAAFQTCFEKLADNLNKPIQQRTHDTKTRPAPAPADELALRSNLPVPK